MSLIREETEVKNIEWAIKEIEGLGTESSQNYPHDEMVEKEIVLGILNQLDKPEVLSQEWASVPQFVADWYESEGAYNSWWNWFYKWGRDESRTELETKTIRWMQDFNEEKFVDMFRYGYTVEEEQKYVIELPNITGSDERYLVQGDDGDLWIDGGLDYLQKHDLPKHTFTEEEIKSFDTKYMTFAKPVKELEE